MIRDQTWRDTAWTRNRGAPALLGVGLGLAVLGFVVASATAGGGVVAPLIIAGGGVAALGLLSGPDHGWGPGQPSQDHQRSRPRRDAGHHRPVGSDQRASRAAGVDRHHALQTTG